MPFMLYQFPTIQMYNYYFFKFLLNASEECVELLVYPALIACERFSKNNIYRKLIKQKECAFRV